MVSRGLNKPMSRVMGKPLFWLYQVRGVSWTCNKCAKNQPKGSVVFEVFLKSELKIDDGFRGTKGYVCLDCAEQLLDDAKTRVAMCKLYGPEGYAAMTDA